MAPLRQEVATIGARISMLGLTEMLAELAAVFIPSVRPLPLLAACAD